LAHSIKGPGSSHDSIAVVAQTIAIWLSPQNISVYIVNCSFHFGAAIVIGIIVVPVIAIVIPVAVIAVVIAVVGSATDYPIAIVNNTNALGFGPSRMTS
jgi:hypothetical protein